MSKLTLVRTHQASPHVQQSDLRRGWMDDTYNKHAYRCLPITMANVNGWEVLLPCDVVVKWDGGQTVPTLIEGGEHDHRMVANCNKIGMVDFQLGWAFNTEEGYHTWLTGSPNYFVEGLPHCLQLFLVTGGPTKFRWLGKLQKLVKKSYSRRELLSHSSLFSTLT